VYDKLIAIKKDDGPGCRFVKVRTTNILFIRIEALWNTGKRGSDYSQQRKRGNSETGNY